MLFAKWPFRNCLAALNVWYVCPAILFISRYAGMHWNLTHITLSVCPIVWRTFQTASAKGILYSELHAQMVGMETMPIIQSTNHCQTSVWNICLKCVAVIVVSLWVPVSHSSCPGSHSSCPRSHSSCIHGVEHIRMAHSTQRPLLELTWNICPAILAQKLRKVSHTSAVLSRFWLCKCAHTLNYGIMCSWQPVWAVIINPTPKPLLPWLCQV